MSLDSAFIADGKNLGYEGQDLRDYVGERKAEYRRAEEEEREARRLQANSAPTGPVTNRSFIKLAAYKEGEDVSIYLNTFEKVKEANQWSDSIAVTALLNGFANTKAIHRPSKGASTDACDQRASAWHGSRSRQGGVVQDVPSNKGAASTETDPRKCYSSGSMGHFARHCPEKRKSKYDRQLRDEGPRTKDSNLNVNASLSNPEFNNCLPISHGFCNGKSVRVLRDTGATVVVVRRSLVPEGSISKETARLTFADEHSVNAPKAMIDLKCPHFTGRVEALCLTDIPFDVLLGNIPGATSACGAKASLGAATEEVTGEHAWAVQTRAQRKEEHSRGKLPIPTKVSSMPVQFDLDKLSADDMVRFQSEDASLKSCFRKSEIISTGYPRFVSRNGVLLRLNNRGRRTKDVVQQIVLPTQFRHKVMRLAHDTVLSGHLGTRKTQDRIFNHFYWPGYFDDVRRFCQSCEVCQTKVSSKPARAPLINLPIIDKPFDRVAVDIIGSSSRCCLPTVRFHKSLLDFRPLSFCSVMK
ncbi:hypothetical protein HAZT_HAZT006694 [Hyalella azteca]|uniref:CCHC-type domain-containing protein n=1 Tax=Hyalella azteca TaxID=294128 RepID=A0A6A0HAH1_HYAAZ|nr:hypothetical protein HAZT_HAZT006694 [Hyalella azteca]